MAHFRFESLDIWKLAGELSIKLFDLSNSLEKKKLYRFAEQLRGAGLSVSNNIAEGSGSSSDKEFSHFLNISRRSLFECANIILILSKDKSLDIRNKEKLLSEIDILSRKITNFRKSLKKPNNP